MISNQTVTVKLQNKVSGALSNAITLNYSVTTLSVGMDAPNGAEWTQAVSDYPGITYSRDFGTDGADTDTLPELSSRSAGKWTALPAGAVMHVSWKDDVNQLSTWLNGLNQYIYVTWYHEPMGDVTPATYQATGQQVTNMINAHPNKAWVLGHGPIVTRYWLDEGAGNPTDFGYPGMTHYGVDCYMNAPTAGSYYTTAKMFDTPFNKIRAAYPGIRLWVPEYGVARINSDTTGSGRAAAMHSHITYLRTLPYVDGVAYFNSSAFPQYQLSSTSPEATEWRSLQASQ